MYCILRAGFQEVTIGPPTSIGGNDRRFDDREEAESYLLALADSDDERFALRNVIVAMSGVSWVSETGSIKVAADLLVTGRLGVREAVRLSCGNVFQTGTSWLAERGASLPAERLSLADIQSSYVVGYDTMVQYSPIPLASSMDQYSKELTTSEVRLLDALGWWRLLGFKDTADLAAELSKQCIPDGPIPPWVVDEAQRKQWNGQDGHRDALRHAMWNALMTQRYGLAWTEAFATAHERTPVNQATPARMAMDLYNNEQGRRIGTRHPRTEPQGLLKILLEELKLGNLLVVDRTGAINWSNLVNRYEHGVANVNLGISAIVTVDLLKALGWRMPAAWAPALNAACARYSINTPQRLAMFLAQVGHESGGGQYTSEIWGPTAAQKGYEGRADLGNNQTGDGLRFKGRGLIQITGRANTTEARNALKPGMDLEAFAKWLESEEGAATSAAWWWADRGLNTRADAGNFDSITRKINGGLNGKADRDQRLKKAKEQLFVGPPAPKPTATKVVP